MIEVIKPGLFTTIQDEGREFHRSQGIPVSGAMDQQSFHFANFLLNNEEGTPVLEFTQQGPTLYFHARTNVVLTGGRYNAQLNGENVPYSTPFSVSAGSELNVGKVLSGNYGYLSIEGGFHTHDVLGSASYCPDVNESAFCKKGNNFVFVRPTKTHFTKNAQVRTAFNNSSQKLIVKPGPEFNKLTLEQREGLENAILKIGRNSSRMAIELEHDLPIRAKDIITAPVQPGTVQLTPDGSLIALMRDAQTTGGYARILQLGEEEINQLSQVRVGDTLSIEITLDSEE